MKIMAAWRKKKAGGADVRAALGGGILATSKNSKAGEAATSAAQRA